MKKSNSSKCCGCISKHFFTCVVILFLIVIGPVLIAVDLTFLTEWINSLRMGDFYTYLTFIGIVSVWSIYGLITTVMKSASGITVYMVGLIFITVIHFIIGFIHIMLLFTTYRPILLDSCLQRQPTRLFWWSLGYDDNEEIKKIYMACSTQWISFATERFVSWIVYSFISFLCLYFVVRYQRYITHQRNKAQGVVTGATDGDWSDDGDDYSTFVEKKKQDGSTDKVTYYHEEFPTTKSEDSELSANMHQQRQKLFDVIAKRKRARSSLNRRPTIGNPSEETVNVVHPLDLAQDLDDYEPPPMPPAEDTSESWNRYNDELLKEEQEALERQKRVDSLSTERLEYEMYRSHGSKSRESSISETVRKDASRRKRPSTARWSACFTETGMGTHPMSHMREEFHPDEKQYNPDEGQDEEQGEHRPDQYQQDESGHEGPKVTYFDQTLGESMEHGVSDSKVVGEQGKSEFMEEDNYEDYQQEEHLPEDASPTQSFLMKPGKEETM